MRKTGSIALSALVMLYCAVTKGDHSGTSSPSFTPSFTPPATTSSPPSSSTTQLESMANSTSIHPNVSSGADRISTEVSLNGSFAQGGHDTRNTTIAGTTDASAAGGIIDDTDAPPNATESQDTSALSAGGNQTVSNPPPATVMVNTILPSSRAAGSLTQTSTSSPPAESPSRPTPTGTRGPASSHSTIRRTTTAAHQTWHKDLTISVKQVTSPTTTSTTTTSTSTQNMEASKPDVSTPVQAKARAETPSELNVGDEESSTSLDPLLAGLVSVFVVTTAIISLLIFLKFRHRNERPEFRRLQDLPMDDMMEDTPLSMYSY